MADNEQNTYAGGGGPLAAPTGNGILDSFLRLSDVAVTAASNVYGFYDNIKERELARQIALENATRAPQQSMPASRSFSPADYLSDPARVQALFGYGALAALLAAGAVWMLKKR